MNVSETKTLVRKWRNFCLRISFDELSFAPLAAMEKFSGEGTIAGNKLCKITKRARFEGTLYIIRGQRWHNYHPRSALPPPPVATGKRRKSEGNSPRYEMRAGLLAPPVFRGRSLVRFPQRKQPEPWFQHGTRLHSTLPPLETSGRTPLCVPSVNGYAKQSNYAAWCSRSSPFFSLFGTPLSSSKN